MSPDHVFVHCTSPGPFNGNKNTSPFASETEIRLEFLYAPPVPISMSCIAALESQRRKGKLDTELGRRLLGAGASTEVSVNEILRRMVPGYTIQKSDDLSFNGATAHIGPLMNLAGFLALFDKDPMVGYRWMKQNRLSFFSIPGFKGEVFENVCNIMEKREVLNLTDQDVALLAVLADKLKPLEGK